MVTSQTLRSRRIATALLIALLLGCASVPSPRLSQQVEKTVNGYDLTRDVDGNPVWTVHVDPPAKLGAWYWITYALALGTAAWDVHETFVGLDRCATCAEANPVMRPFVKMGEGATYGVTLSLTVFQMEIARRLKQRHERAWALGPAIGIGVHGAAAISNSRQGQQ